MKGKPRRATSHLNSWLEPEKVSSQLLESLRSPYIPSTGMYTARSLVCFCCHSFASMLVVHGTQRMEVFRCTNGMGAGHCWSPSSFSAMAPSWAAGSSSLPQGELRHRQSQSHGSFLPITTLSSQSISRSISLGRTRQGCGRSRIQPRRFKIPSNGWSSWREHWQPWRVSVVPRSTLSSKLWNVPRRQFKPHQSRHRSEIANNFWSELEHIWRQSMPREPRWWPVSRTAPRDWNL